MPNMTMKLSLFCLAVPIMLISIGASTAEGSASKATTYECRRATGSIVIDGKIDEDAWKNAQVQQFVLPVTLGIPNDRTEARLLWDDKYLYVAFKAFDKDVWSYLTQRDSWTCREDCLEIFLKPDSDKDAYYDFEINALGTVMDAFIRNWYAGGDDLHRWTVWNCTDMKVGVFVKGTLNNPDDLDEYWQMEVAIPFSHVHAASGKTPSPGDTWRVNLARCDYSMYLPSGWELSSAQTEPGSRPDFHVPALWNYLRFSK